MQAFRASLFDFIDDPYTSSGQSYRYFKDGLLIVEDGLVTSCGEYSALENTLPENTEIVDYSGYLIMPGFIDTHLHYPQTDIIASHGAQLLDWLERYTFPTEKRFSDPSIARETAEFFVQELLRNGTTSAMVFATVHAQSVDAIFNAASKQNMRLISGKVMMDRHAPEYLCDTPESSYDDSMNLINKWHNHGRLLYAVTPRFAPTSSEQQLKVAQQLVNEFPDVYLQSHVAENPGEVEWVSKLFPWSRSYLDVYDHFGLLGNRSVYAHCIYLDETDRDCLARSGTAVSFCPTSNLFLGSGLFDMKSTLEHGLRLSIGTDVGGGTSFSMLKTLHEAYKVNQMKGFNMSPFQAIYMATLGGAKSLYLDDKLGNFEVGKEADFIVVDKNATPLMKRRMEHAENLEDELFALMILGDDRNIKATHIMGECCYERA
mgnify:FL=1